ncbi:helix-turn-helix domain-containing protein [Flavobacterium sp. ANB]|uniref:AraC family transcriptional regulator n=1 Tax=unclassified Flavobacterium TaxID=196869 RepID=UPI0012B9DC98|nr:MULTISPECIES: helix-turn-helix domain-containing protein [unclassified Flavobacterium]MBF4516958.1 helix-turn-helix domain-containing protein [Flavobacterium sp. ANB]MTD69146.1 helix-turn-helix domain-containing protein [Flavobacterium sp. LC2016-13]
MKNQNHTIKQFELSPLAKAGIIIVNMKNPDVEEHDISKPHRDNHCQLMLALNGTFKLNIDFENVEFSAPALLCVFPEQVHHIIDVKNPKGWMISFDPSLVSKEILQLLENKIDNPFLLQQESKFCQQLSILMDLIEKVQAENTNNYTQKSIHSLLNALLSLISGELVSNLSVDKEKENRSIIIKEIFINLTKEHFKTWKQPAQYASALSISAAHLNDTVKSLTGSPVSVHIQEASIMEAKRLLYFTDKNVKEIAYEVGYDEPVYFGKLFKKVTNLTPLEFRKKFRD